MSETPLDSLQRMMRNVEVRRLGDVLAQRAAQIICLNNPKQPVEVPPIVWGLLQRLPTAKSKSEYMIGFGLNRPLVLRPNIRKPHATS